MNKTDSLQALLNGTAIEEDVALLKRLLASGEISIGGNVNQSVIGSNNDNKSWHETHLKSCMIKSRT